MDDFSNLTKKELIELLERKNDVAFASEDELAKVDRMAQQSDPNRIPFKETADHQNIKLYTPLNKVIGPLHPSNARATIQRWKKAGYPLYTEKRTPEQIEEYKKTAFYKSERAKHVALRKARKSNSGQDKMQEYAKEIGKVMAVEVAKATTTTEQSK